MQSENPYPLPRNPRACEACRTSKSRCFASERPNVCQRCVKFRLTCSVRSTARPKRRKKVALTLNNGTVAEGSDATEDDPGSVYIKLNALSLPSSRANVAILHQHHQHAFKQFLPSESQAEHPLTPSSVRNSPEENILEQPEPDELTPQRNLTIDQAEKLLQKFHEFSHYFPFVVVPKDATIKSLSRNSPFLLLAILNASSSTNIPLNHQLDHEFKRILSEKIIFEGRKSLDFLQGLLVYVAWYPCHLKPRNRQAFLYINLTISLADDLGLSQRDPMAPNLCPDNLDTEGLFENHGFSRAAKRAYIGCYYLSSSISVGFQKPNSLKYCAIIDDYATSLAEDPEFWSDPLLRVLNKGHHIQEKIRDSIHTQQLEVGNLDASPFQEEMHVQAFHNEVEEWKRSVPDEFKSLPYVTLSERYLSISIFCNGLAFLTPMKAGSERQLNPVTLSRCLDASKNFFETLLSIPAVQYGAFNNVQWSQIVLAIIVLSRLSFPLPRCPGWDTVAARERAPLGMFLECLCYRMQALSTTSPKDPMPKNPDGPFIFRMVLESIKKTYEQRLELVMPKPMATLTPEHTICPYATPAGYCTPGATVTANVVADTSLLTKFHCPMNDKELLTFLEPFQLRGADAQPAVGHGIGIGTKPSHIPLYHDLWATMTMSWTDD